MLFLITADISQPSLPNCLPLCLLLTNEAAVFVSEGRGNASHPWWKNWKTPGSTNSSRAGKWTRIDFFVLLNMGIFQPAMLVYQRVLFSETTQIFVPVCQEETDPVALRVLRNSWRVPSNVDDLILTIPGTECMACLPSRELTYPTLGKGKPSSKCHFWEIC